MLPIAHKIQGRTNKRKVSCNKKKTREKFAWVLILGYDVKFFYKVRDHAVVSHSINCHPSHAKSAGETIGGR